MYLSNFDTSKVKSMEGMFLLCSELISLNMINFDTIQVTSMKAMFSGCSQLISLNITNFKTSSVTNMGEMFYSCSKLNSLDLSNFNTSSVSSIEHMFSGCSELISLDLSNFNTSLVTNMNCIFYSCSKLEYVNLKNAKINFNLKLTDTDKCNSNPTNLTICSEDAKWSTLFNLSNINCINNISSFNKNDIENKMKCFITIKDLNNACKICGNNYFKKNVIINNIIYIICYEYKEGYYFDDIDLNYKPC